MSRALKKNTSSYHTKMQKTKLTAWADSVLRSYQTPAAMVELAGALLPLPQVPTPVIERFAPGVYLREIFMPAGSLIIGKRHRTEHFNIVTEGAVRYLGADGQPATLRAPQTFVSGAGVQKMFVVLKDCRWQTVHANPAELRETSLLEDTLIDRATTEAILGAAKQQTPALAGATA